MNNSNDQYQQLKNEIRNHDHAYYILDDPKISDAEYDDLFQKLLKIESDNPSWVSPESQQLRQIYWGVPWWMLKKLNEHYTALWLIT